MPRTDIGTIHWDSATLLAIHVSEQLVRELTADEARDLLKGILYLKERYGNEKQEAS